MVNIITLTLAPSLDSATTTNRLYTEGKLRCDSPRFEPGGGGINVARAIVNLGGQARALFPIGGPTGHYLAMLLQQEGVDIDVIHVKDWTRQNLHVHITSSGDQYRFVMPGAMLTNDELTELEQKILKLEKGTLLVISGSLPPGVAISKLQQVVKIAHINGLVCIIDSSGPALEACLQVGNLALIKPNQKELAILDGHSLRDPDAVFKAATKIISRGQAKRVVVSLGAQGALAVDSHSHIQIMAPPVRALSTVGAGDSMVGAMTMKLAMGASFNEMVRFGVAAGTAATLNSGTKLCNFENTQHIYNYLCQFIDK